MGPRVRGRGPRGAASSGGITSRAAGLEAWLAGYDQTAALRDGPASPATAAGNRYPAAAFHSRQAPENRLVSLTDTQRAVSDLVAKGLTNQQIAGEMFLSTHTVAFHLRQVFRKLDISSSA